MKLAAIGILGGLLLLWGPLDGQFWPGIALIGVGGLSLVLAIRALIRREPEDEIEVEGPAGRDDVEFMDEELALLTKAAEHRRTPDRVVDDRRYRGLEIAVRFVIAIGTVALVVMKVFLWSPEAIERGKREEDLRKLEMQLVKDARAGKTGKALQFLVTGDRSLLKSAKSKDAGPTAAKGRDQRQLLEVIETTKEGAGPPAIKGPGDPRPASPRP